MICTPTLPAPGSRVGFVCGPGSFARDHAGIVLTHVSDRWGTHAIVLMDDGTTRVTHGLTTVGIGCHQL